MAGHPYAVLDVFTDTPLEGNPLAVFTDATGLDEGLMRALARETNLSETVFVLAPEDGGDARVRIFTPTSELPFAGHPVLGTAVLLGVERDAEAIVLECATGPVRVTVRKSGPAAGSGRMEQPIPAWEPYDRAADLLGALGVADSLLPVELYDNGPQHVIVLLGSVDELGALRPDMAALAGHPQVNCLAAAGDRWRLRNFSPCIGVPEDPATGSAAGPIAVHLARHGRISFGEEIELRQGVEMGRPSRLWARATGTAERVGTVEVEGAAVIVAAGAYTL